MQFTAEQRTAITTHDRDLIVTAGAGSGKTRVLVERFMHLLDSNPDWTLPQIVAITFTEKAAREMRDRVHRAIQARIARALAEGDSAALARWTACEADLTRARIGTVHSLCAQVLRANPAEARIDPGFGVLDENDAAMLRDEAVEAALAWLGADADAAPDSTRPTGADLLAAYDLWQVRAVLQTFADRSKAAEVRAALDEAGGDLRAYWAAQWESMVADVIASLRADDELRAALDWLAALHLPDGDKLADICRVVRAHLPGLDGDDPQAVAAALDAVQAAIKLNVGSAKNWGSKELVAEVKAALGAIRERARDYLADLLPPLDDERDGEAAQWIAAWAAAIEQVAAIYAEMKAQRGVLDFDDLEARARDLLCEHENVAARYCDEFRHILVDEFQDTNDAQRRIVYALAGADTGQPGSGCGRLFVVGDPKQSIYAFRGADVTVFGQVRDDIVAGGGEELPLSMSFRTQANLVGAFNDLFGHILDPAHSGSGAAARYAVELGTPLRAFRPAEAFHAQPLTVFALPKPDQEPESGKLADMIREWEALTLAEYLHALVEAQTPVYDRALDGYRPLDYGDVAILFQAMSRAPHYEDVFKAAGLPYVTVAGKGYYDRQEVWDMLNLLAVLHNPVDDLALAAVLRSPVFGLSDDALLALRLPAQGRDRPPLWDTLFADAVPVPDPDIPARDYARAVLRDLRDVAGRMTVADLLVRALDLTGYAATLTGLSDGERRRGNLEKLVALARRSGRVGLGEFMTYARELTAREVREGEAAVEVKGAVTLMSVHASKGLEFPVVVLADASWTRTSRSTDPFVLDPDIGAACKLPADDPDSDDPDPFAYAYAAQLAERRDRAERKRLFYVGATRAQDYLIVSGTLHRCGAHAWLRQLLDALGVSGEDLTPDDHPVRLAYDWGDCALHVPRTLRLPDDLPQTSRQEPESGWDAPHIRAGKPVPDTPPDLPPLLAPVPVAPDAPARSLSATHIAALGRAPFYDPASEGAQRVRHAILHDAPDPVRPLPDREIVHDPAAWQMRRIVGQMVHRALQAWALPDRTGPAELDTRLRAYAWDAHLSDPNRVADAIHEARGLLHRFQRGPLRQQLDSAHAVYREVPFMLRYGGRTLHGIIDVLFRDDRGWYVLDYKTAPVGPALAEDNARRYYLQAGIYARAVAAQTGTTPHAALYYIHPAHLVRVDAAQWEPVLDHLEATLGAALGV